VKLDAQSGVSQLSGQTNLGASAQNSLGVQWQGIDSSGTSITTTGITTGINSYPYYGYPNYPNQQIYQIPYGYASQQISEPVKPVTDLPEETIVAAVVAWRSWMVSPFTDELKSYNGTVWTPYEWLKAKCANQICGGLGCSCGIYCMKSPEYLTDEGYGFSSGFRYTRIYGEVYLKGHILQAKKGYRASHAYPKSFVDTGALARRMATVFGAALIPAPADKRSGVINKVMDALGKL
jgi:hypothetical protein